MYRYAIKKKDELQLNEVELFETHSSLQSHVIMGSVPVLSVLVAAIFGHHLVGSIISGFTYMLYPLIFAIWGRARNKVRKKLLSKT